LRGGGGRREARGERREAGSGKRKAGSGRREAEGGKRDEEQKTKNESMRFNRTTQEKLQAILKTQDYSIRYEKGNFKGGYCIVMQEKMIIINKFFPLESKINTMIEIIRDLEMDDEKLSEDQMKMVQKLREEGDI
jgi:hypothetical protein